MRAAALLLVLAFAAAAHADEAATAAARVRGLIEKHDYEAAVAEANAALDADPDHRLLAYLRAQARVLVAREIQRREGYGAAVAYLEPRLDHSLVGQAFWKACLWDGQEERGLRALRASPIPAADRWLAEVKLLIYNERYEEAARVAAAADQSDWVDWCRRQHAQRERLAARADLGTRMTLGGIAFVLALAGALIRWAPKPAR